MGEFPKNCPRVRSRGGFRNSSLRNFGSTFLLPLAGKLSSRTIARHFWNLLPPNPSWPSPLAQEPIAGFRWGFRWVFHWVFWFLDSTFVP